VAPTAPPLDPAALAKDTPVSVEKSVAPAPQNPLSNRAAKRLAKKQTAAAAG
jgi:hypothetical protein